MFNVLPQNLKSAIKSEYRLRWWITLVSLVIFLEVAALIFIMPSWISSYYKEKDMADEEATQSASPVSQSSNTVLKAITQANQELSAVQSNFVHPEIPSVLRMIISYKSAGISINDFTYQSV